MNGIELLAGLISIVVGVRSAAHVQRWGGSRFLSILVGVIAGLGVQTLFYTLAGVFVATSMHNYYGAWRR